MRSFKAVEWLAVMVSLIALSQWWLVNWLWLMAGWWGVKKRWGEIWLMGLMVDWWQGKEWGRLSAGFLLVGLLGWWISQWLPLRAGGTVRLKE